MSWFDTKGLASLAKNALKEAQKQIDKALDIQDVSESVEELAQTKAVILTTVSKEKSQTAPSTPTTQHILDSQSFDTQTAQWVSFTGSFFENAKSREMITTPPKSGQRFIPVTIPSLASNSIDSNIPMKRQSVTSNSDSVELLSPPTSPSPELTSPLDAANNSESVELITAPLSTEIISPDSVHSLRESIVIIGSNEGPDDDDDSMSYNTVMDDSTLKHNAGGDCKSIVNSVINRCNVPCSIQKTQAPLEEGLFESQTVNSDSTQSFEDIQMAEVVQHSSSDERDLVKINSGPPSSDPNSNDEIDTTTSSDIEIISNPNGDSSSTNSASRSSPQKLGRPAANGVKYGHTNNVIMKKIGHFRESSAVSIQSEDSQSEIEKLLFRISELNEILETRELRLLEFGRENAILQDRNHELQTSLDFMKRNTEHLESDEYTKRLSALEKKFQISIRERDSLRLQLKTLKEELESKIQKDDLSQVVSQNNIIIFELRCEGEKLAKEILQQSNIIKKLRSKEKSSETILKKNKEQIADLTDEIERLKKTLNAKEEVERSQIEAVHKMVSERRKLEEENTQLRSQVDDTHSKLSSLRTRVDTVKIELEKHNKVKKDLSRANEEIVQLKKVKEKALFENTEISHQVNELREKLRTSETGMTMREQKLREENASLLKRLEESETRAENLTQEVSSTSMPLMRQIESLQSTLVKRKTCWEIQEKELIRNLDQAQARLKALKFFESDSKEEVDILQARCLDLEKKLSQALFREEKNTIASHQANLDFTIKETNFKRQISDNNEILDATKLKLEELREKCNLLEAKYEAERECADNVNERHPDGTEINDLSLVRIEENQQDRGNTSPVISLGRNSIEDAMCGNIDWQADELDCLSSSGHQTSSVYGMHISLPSFGHNATTLEHLQSILKQRDGEVSQLQWELSRLQVEREVLNKEISSLTLELENNDKKLQTYKVLKKNFSELQHQYDALLQMYGEKMEKAQELELDLQDVKDMYKAQINDLLREQNKKMSSC